MSYHETYVFAATDAPLSAEALAKAHKISSHAEVSARRFAVSYDYGSFKGEPDAMVAQWYDVHLYRSSTSARFVVRLPFGTLTAADLEEFTDCEFLDITRHGDQMLLAWHVEELDGQWIDEAEVGAELDTLAAVRAALLQGDLRSLYLAWASQAACLDEEELEAAQLHGPSVPAGLATLDDAHTALADLLQCDDDFLTACARDSPAQAAPATARQAATWLAGLPAATKDAALAELLVGGDGAVAALRRNWQQHLRSRATIDSQSSRRTVRQLLAETRQIEVERGDALLAAQVRARAEHLAQVATRKDAIWREVATYSAGTARDAPQQIVSRIKDLRDAAALDGSTAAYESRLAAFVATVGRTRVLHKVLVTTGLVAG